VSFDVSDVWAGGGEFGMFSEWNISLVALK